MNIDIPDLEYEQWCGHCCGEGKVDGKPCHNCRGRGYYLTTEGEKLLLLLEHQGFRRYV